jgi:hypothetical protein
MQKEGQKKYLKRPSLFGKRFEKEARSKALAREKVTSRGRLLYTEVYNQNF